MKTKEQIFKNDVLYLFVIIRNGDGLLWLSDYKKNEEKYEENLLEMGVKTEYKREKKQKKRQL